MRKELNIAFWLKNSGNACSHGQGLTEEQIKELRELEVGDRLILFKNKHEGETKPHFNLKVFISENKSEGGL
jgi:hypothetical protein